MKRKKKRYGGPSTLRRGPSWFSKRFLEDDIGDDEREDVIGQPNDKAEGK